MGVPMKAIRCFWNGGFFIEPVGGMCHKIMVRMAVSCRVISGRSIGGTPARLFSPLALISVIDFPSILHVFWSYSAASRRKDKIDEIITGRFHRLSLPTKTTAEPKKSCRVRRARATRLMCDHYWNLNAKSS